LVEPVGERHGLVKGEHGPAAWLRIEVTGEARLHAGRLVGEGQWFPGLQMRRQAGAILHILQFDAGEGVADLLCLDSADRHAIDDEEIVGSAAGERELPYGHTSAGPQIQRVEILDQPARLGEQRIDALARALFRQQRHRPLAGRQRPHAPIAPQWRPTYSGGVRSSA